MRYPRDPYWLNLRRRDVCAKCHAEMKPGERGFYYPNTKTILCDSDSCGGQASRDFAAAKFDESVYGGGYGGKRRQAQPSAMLFYAREDPKGYWKHLMAISDGRLVLFEMEPAYLVGWNLHRTTVQGAESWEDMSAASIVAFKQSSGDSLLRPATAGEVEWMKSKLAATAGGKRKHSRPRKRKAEVRVRKPRKVRVRKGQRRVDGLSQRDIMSLPPSLARYFR